MRKIITLLSIAALMTFMVPVFGYADSFVNTIWDGSGSYSTSLGNMSVGEFTLQLRDGDGELINGGEWFTGFCVDPWQSAKIGGELEVEFVSPEEYNNGLDIAWIFDSYHSENSSDAQIGALQLAFWEIVSDNDYDLGEGNFEVYSTDSEAFQLASSYLASLPQSYSSAEKNWLNSSYIIGKHGSKQDFIVEVGGPEVGGPEPVPEPATMLLLGIGCLGIAGLTRKRKK
jgi:hypothetical protein